MRSLWQIFGLFFKALRHGFRVREFKAKMQSAALVLQTLDSVMDAYRRGDYETALQAADAFGKAGNETSYCFYRGSMLMHLGRLEEAEPLQRRCVVLQTDPRRSALARSSLGQNLQEQHRCDEAMKCFEAALRAFPGKGSVHRHMAELCLQRGDCPNEALRWATLAVDEERVLSADTPGMQNVNNLNLGEALATRAWAVAAASRDREEVDLLIAEALPLMNSTYFPPRAQVRYHAGQAYAALGDTARSGTYFEEAARLDPHGMWGRAAAGMLAGTCK